jgi:hypothetical protein
MPTEREMKVYRGSVHAGGLWWFALAVGTAMAIVSCLEGRLAAGLFVFCACGLVTLLPLSRALQSLVLHDNGIVWSGLFRRRAILRDKIHGARIEVYDNRIASGLDLFVVLSHGKEIRLRGLSDADEAAQEIVARYAMPVTDGGSPFPPVSSVYGPRA